jgi:hypothetical protein
MPGWSEVEKSAESLLAEKFTVLAVRAGIAQRISQAFTRQSAKIGTRLDNRSPFPRSIIPPR